MDISVRNRGIGAWSSKVAAIDCCNTLRTKRNCWPLFQENEKWKSGFMKFNSRRPSFSGLHGEERQHGNRDLNEETFAN